MAAVPQKTLNWLYDVLRREYRDPNRAYSDVAQTLAQYPSLAPRTDVYTSENGAPALLLNLKGTVPVNFRGTIYRFPIAIWIPHAYPHEAPVVYVTPTEDMMVRQGQHVSGADGKVYHHYLSQWAQTWDRSNTIELVKILADIFAREPPVMARQQSNIPQQPSRNQGPSSSVPTQRYQPQGVSGQMQTGPPPPPPKQSVSGVNPVRSDSRGPMSPASAPSRYDAPPPLPKNEPSSRPQGTHTNGHMHQLPQAAQYTPQRQSSQNHQQGPRQAISQQYQAQSPAGPISSPQSHSQRVQSYSQPGPAPTHQNYQQIQHQSPMPQGQAQPQLQAQVPSQKYQPQPQHYNQSSHQHPPPQAQPLSQPKPPQPKDLLSEEDPFQLTLPTTSHSSHPQPSAPPIPTNPEKTALLSHLSHLILQTLHTTIQTSTSALPSLTSQTTALSTSHQTLTSELHALQTLSSHLQSNNSSLQSTLSSADTTIKSTSTPNHPSNPSNIPSIDEIIIPPTVIARQLYDNVAEQRGYEAAIYALNEGFVRGRVGGDVWGRKCREMAREEFRRKWMVRRIGRGLGLEGVD